MVTTTAIVHTFQGMKSQDSDVPKLDLGHTSGHKSQHSPTKAIANGQETTPLLQKMVEPPRATWTKRRRSKDDRVFPQAIAHRGYQSEYPENTLRAFEEAAKVGAHAIETDIHLSRDNVVVLSHDPDLKRCFGEKKKIIDCDWEYLKGLRTLKEPHEKMPRLQDHLEFLASPEREDLWTLLDIKLDNNADNVMRLIANTLQSVRPGKRRWQDRVVLGCWAAKYVPLCTKYLPDYPITHIGFSTAYARQFLRVPNTSFNMLQQVLLGPVGARFMHDVKVADRELFVWTVNEENMMKWCIQKEVDGVITDNPKKYLEICENWDDDEPEARQTLMQWVYTLGLWVLMWLFRWMFRVKFPEELEDML